MNNIKEALDTGLRLKTGPSVYDFRFFPIAISNT